MEMHELDTKMVDAVLAQAGLVGWRDVNLVEAAQEAGLDLGAVRSRFSGRTAVLLRFGSLMDQAVLDALAPTGLPREKLFDLVMGRFDHMQRQRAGVLSVMETLRFDPGMAMLLGGATARSMKWMLEAAGVPANGLVGTLRVQGMVAVWLYALRAWEKDESADLGATMSAVDRALDRAVQAEAMLPGGRPVVPSDVVSSDVVTGDVELNDTDVSDVRVDDIGAAGSVMSGASAAVVVAPPMLPATAILDADGGPAVM